MIIYRGQTIVNISYEDLSRRPDLIKYVEDSISLGVRNALERAFSDVELPQTQAERTHEGGGCGSLKMTMNLSTAPPVVFSRPQNLGRRSGLPGIPGERGVDDNHDFLPVEE